MLTLFTMGANSVFVLPVLVPFYINQIGLDFRAFMIGEAVFSLVIILAEVPTGWLSDVWRRRSVLVLGAVIDIIGYILIVTATGFWQAIIAQGVLGIGIALVSGTLSALLYESLAADGREEEYRAVEGRRHGFGLYATGVAAVIGAGLYAVNPYLPLIVDIITLFLALVCACLITEPARPPEKTEQSAHRDILGPFRDMGRAVKYALRGHEDVGAIILLGALVFSTTKILMWAQQPYYMALGIDEGWYGLFMAAGLVLGGLGGQFGHRLEGNATNRTIMGLMLVFVTLMAVASAIGPGWHGIILLISGSLIWGIGYPHLQDALNKRIAPERRATILSAASLAMHLLFVPKSVALGHLGTSVNITFALGLQGLFLAVSGTAVYALWIARDRRGKGL